MDGLNTVGEWAGWLVAYRLGTLISGPMTRVGTTSTRLVECW